MIRGLKSQLHERRPGGHAMCCTPKLKHLLSQAVEENELPTTTREPRDPGGPRVQLDERKVPLISIGISIQTEQIENVFKLLPICIMKRLIDIFFELFGLQSFYYLNQVELLFIIKT